ncbi:sigma-70 family RNA polymerase sigma factor [Streptosporangium sp. NPDC051022]|uniref:sigma-70 family RNA polymerase sigma factor n=1 Tax=Streptosporangium sp. NPDC051022 TaxID=3155752 RepID=UPI003425BE42
MPGWPAVGRTDDQRLVEALRRADATAPADLYDSYAERLNDYASSLLGDRGAAADAVHDALVTAVTCAERLREPGRLRPWLYALTRARCGSAPRGRRGPAPDDPGGPGDPGGRELTELVHEALAELGERERQALELSLRHGLGAGEAGLALGLTSRQVTAAVKRARDHLENAAAAVVLARVGRAHCPDLSAMVDSWEGPLSTMLRRRLSGHIGRCEVCTERRNRHVSADGLLDLVPPALPPLSLRRRVIETCVSPESAATRASIASAGDRFDRAGFPVTAGGRARARGRTGTGGTGTRRTGTASEAGEHRNTAPEARRAPDGPRRTAGAARRAEAARRRGRTRRVIPVIVAALCVLVATGILIVITGHDVAGGQGARAEAARSTGPAPSPVPTPTAPGTSVPESAPVPGRETGRGSGEPAEPLPTPTSSPRRTERTGKGGRTGTAAPTPGRVTPPPRRPTAERPRAGRTPTAPPVAARLAVSCPTEIEQGTGRIRLTARNTAISWSAITSDGISVHPRRGRLRAGATGVIWITVSDPDVSGSGRVSFTSAGGGSSCAISWETPAPQASEPAGDPPPEPTQAPSPAPGQEAETT